MGTFLKHCVMRSFARTALACCLLALAACDGGTNTSIAALEARVAALEHRPARARTAASDGENTGGESAIVERLDADLHSLERRLAEVEAEVAVFRDALDGEGLDGAGEGAARRARRSERRERMRALTLTYRDKLAEVRQQYRDDPTDPERQRALRDVVEWYRRERRAAMRGE